METSETPISEMEVILNKLLALEKLVVNSNSVTINNSNIKIILEDIKSDIQHQIDCPFMTKVELEDIRQEFMLEDNNRIRPIKQIQQKLAIYAANISMTTLKSSCDVFMKTIWHPYWEAKAGGYTGQSSLKQEFEDKEKTDKNLADALRFGRP